MTKEKIDDLPKNDEISEDDMKSISGGLSTTPPKILKTGSINIVDISPNARDLVTAAADIGPTAAAVLGSTAIASIGTTK